MDWTILITIASLIGTIANVYKKRWCFIIWLVTNAAWAILDYRAGLYSQSLLMIFYVGIAVWGIVQWGKPKDKQTDVPAKM